ncbi:DUF488 domain-containing protein [Aerolutibacter ruishenii]|uniref:Uncharacterized protein YeaO (DUF488 family) n=1 Tax=Aerolutibacter ruishenii TaxID=686800 RepID=A0A562LPD6_9GAMM|nr:DUF488 domain-containing protein [Lysobacter ruishenii]TWI09456.1 uncharacterized protein YeaO (DUF488 family) [Lysobacter ruishenii]
MDVRTKRVYEPAAHDDGVRVLVDRVWPRGIRKEDAHVVEWLKDVAPSTALRQWFNHDPERWDAFRERYAEELESHPEDLAALRALAHGKRLTLVYSARDTEHNQAVVLQQLLTGRRGAARKRLH